MTAPTGQIVKARGVIASAFRAYLTALEALVGGKSDASHTHDYSGTFAALGHTHAGTYEPVITAGTSSQVLLGDKGLGTPSTVNGSSGLGQTIKTPVAFVLTAGGAATMTDAQTLYWGGCAGAAPAALSNTQCFYFPFACTIVGADIWASCATVGTAENWQMSIRKNNTTDTTIATLGANSTQRHWSNYSLDISIAQGDRIEIKSTNPTWATNPANCRFGGVLHVVPA